MEAKRNFIIAGGGTGGHVYPGVAIARAFKQIDHKINVHFVGTVRGIEATIVPAEGYPLHVVSVGQLHSSVGLWKRLRTVLLMPLAIFQCLRLCLTLKPVGILGVGGYASGPMLLVASCLGYRTAIWEPNAMPGMANRVLSRFVSRAYLVFASAQKYLRCKDTRRAGMPVRFEFGEPSARPEKSEVFRVLIFGGSQGAAALNRVVCQALLQGGEWMRGVRFVHQTGSKDFLEVRNAYDAGAQSAFSSVEVMPYLNDMEVRYRAADLVVCRGGASTLAELMACGKPAVIVPLPTAADNHQQKNAEELVNAGAAQMILQKELTIEKLVETLEYYKHHPEQLAQMAARARKLHRPGAAEELARDLLSD